MSFISSIFNNIFLAIGRDVAPLTAIISVMLVILVMSTYEFIIYRAVSFRQIYNKQFHIAIMIIPFFIGSIVMALQSNVVITLGTIGALAIIRFRTAIKDTTDMLYLLWSIFIGITCGCQLYESCIITSILVTLILIFAEKIGMRLFRNPYILVVNSTDNSEAEINSILSSHVKTYRLKSRNYTANGANYVYELSLKQPDQLVKEINNLESVKQFSLLEYDNNDII